MGNCPRCFMQGFVRPPKFHRHTWFPHGHKLTANAVSFSLRERFCAANRNNTIAEERNRTRLKRHGMGRGSHAHRTSPFCLPSCRIDTATIAFIPNRQWYTWTMAPIVLFEDHRYADLLPLVYWRVVGALRCGRKNLIDNAAFHINQHITGLWVRDYLAEASTVRNQIPANQPIAAGTVLVNARWLLNRRHVFRDPPFVAKCGDDVIYISCDGDIASRLSADVMLSDALPELLEGVDSDEMDAELIRYPWDLVRNNGASLNSHWTGDDRGIEGKVSSAAYLVDANYIHIGERSEIKPTAYVDADNGPVYISTDVTIEAHTYVQGPAYIGPGCVIKPHASIRAGTSLGPFCKVGGEISNTLIAGYSNKQHDGFLGDAYLGGWVNLGAGTTNSNLKNTYGEVRVLRDEDAIGTGMQFFGCVIGDFVRTGIGQLIPTGAMIGMASMVANGGLAPRFVPSFSWIAGEGREKADPTRVLKSIRAMMQRRNVDLTDHEQVLFEKSAELAEEHGV